MLGGGPTLLGGVPTLLGAGPIFVGSLVPILSGVQLSSGARGRRGDLCPHVGSTSC